MLDNITTTADLIGDTGRLLALTAQERGAMLGCRFCPECGADVDGNDPHNPDCPKGEHGSEAHERVEKATGAPCQHPDCLAAENRDDA